jgi:hypothetical protein
MPDSSREIVFPEGVPIVSLDGQQITPAFESSRVDRLRQEGTNRPESDVVSTEAEGKLQSDAGQIEQQARHTRQLDGDENLLKSPVRPQGQQRGEK